MGNTPLGDRMKNNPFKEPIPAGGRLIIPNADYLLCPVCGAKQWLMLFGIPAINVVIKCPNQLGADGDSSQQLPLFVCGVCSKVMSAVDIGKATKGQNIPGRGKTLLERLEKIEEKLGLKIEKETGTAGEGGENGAERQ